MFGRQRFLLTSPPPPPNLEPIVPVLPPRPPPPSPPSPIENRSFRVFLFEPAADASGVWFCGPYAGDYIQGGGRTLNAPWAIWVDPSGAARRVFNLESHSSARDGGFFLNRGQLEMLFTTRTAVSVDPNNPFDRPIEALHQRAIDRANGVVRQETFAAPKGDRTYELKFPFRDGDKLYASCHSPPDDKEIRSIAADSWAPVSVLLDLQPPPGWGPGTFTDAHIACPPVLSPDGSWVILFTTTFQPATSPNARIVSAACSVRDLKTVWSTVLGHRSGNVEDVSADVDYTGEVYVALTFSRVPRQENVAVYKMGSDGSQISGWPKWLSADEPLSEAKIRISSRDVFVAGVRGFLFETMRPFVASYKRDGTPSTLFGREFRASDREEWHQCGLAVLNEDFFLAGYTITRDALRPRELEHALQVAKFDRYGILI